MKTTMSPEDFSALEVSRFELRLRAREACRLPAFLGSTLLWQARFEGRLYIVCHRHDFQTRRAAVLPSGFIGDVVYEGDLLSHFLPLVAAGELLNAGAGTALGLGKFEIVC
jgi:CRISPR-associated endoribonuclease Cas6